MVWVRTVPSRTSALVGDSFRSLADLLFGIKAESGFRVPNGTLFSITPSGGTAYAIVVAYGQPPADLATGNGAPVSANSGIGLQSDVEAAWDLAEVWVRNATAGQAATIQVNGPVFAWRAR